MINNRDNVHRLLDESSGGIGADGSDVALPVGGGDQAVRGAGKTHFVRKRRLTEIMLCQGMLTLILKGEVTVRFDLLVLTG